MKMIIDRKKMGKNLNFYFQIFMIIVFMGLFVFNRFESKRPEKENRGKVLSRHPEEEQEIRAGVRLWL